MAHAHVQSGGTFASTTASTLAQAYAGAVTSGNLLVCSVAFEATQTCTVSDSVNGAWTGLPASIATDATMTQPNRTQWFFRENTAAGTPTVTMTCSSNNNYRSLIVFEYSGGATTTPDDVSNGANATSAAPAASLTTTVDHDLLIGVANPLGTSASPGAGFNGRVNADGLQTEDKLDQSPAATISVAFTSTNVKWICSAASFKVPGVVATARPPRRFPLGV